MTRIPGVEPVEIFADRLAAADFSLNEMESISSATPDNPELARDNYNWMAAFLVEEVGLYEVEVADWFRSRAAGLDERTPLEIWSSPDGFETIFDYALRYKEQAEKALEPEPTELGEVLTRSHAVARNAISVIEKCFKSAGMNLELEGGDYTAKQLYNPDMGMDLLVEWQAWPWPEGDIMEQFRVTRNIGPQSFRYFIGRYKPKAGKPYILQTGLLETFNNKLVQGDSDSDINDRPPLIREVSRLIVPLAKEVKNKSLTPR
jgi:hypothetical protein